MRVLLDNRYDELGRLAVCLQAFARQWSLEPSVLHDLTICADELVTNAITYAWADAQVRTLVLEAQKHADRVVLKLSYEGRAFNPFKEVHPPDTKSDMEKRSPGGLGIHIVRSLMTHVDYVRQGSLNVITLSRSLRA